MKRLVPLWIAALGGFILIFAYFIPATQGWGEVAAIWFDILAAIAFILGGGNLLKIHLKKSSDRVPGWGYSVIIAMSFLLMLYVGLVKWGSSPAPNTEYFGQAFASLPVDSIPDEFVYRIPGTIPHRVDSEEIHSSVRAQLSEQGGELVFRGWLRTGQYNQLVEHGDTLEWQCACERLKETAKPGDGLAGKIEFLADHEVLTFTGAMSDEIRDSLKAIGDANWKAAIDELYTASNVPTSMTVDPSIGLPPMLAPLGPGKDLVFDKDTRVLTITGPMTVKQRDHLGDLYPLVRPLTDEERTTLVAELKALGPVGDRQLAVMDVLLEGTWTVEQLDAALTAAGGVQESEKTACEMLDEQQAGATVIDPNVVDGTVYPLNDAQAGLLEEFARESTMTVAQLKEKLSGAGNFKDAQRAALTDFFSGVPTGAEFKKNLGLALMRTKNAQGRQISLSTAQQDVLLGDYRNQIHWRRTIGDLFVAAHIVKFPMSGEYRGQGSPFWWLYEYAFKPLQATTFAMLAFYVASAAFRAFRAKNFEAVLLLGTAFIILLGRTFAGVYLTAWVPDWASGLKIENLTVYIMQVFNTAGNRAIMIGIALGIASTSLKVLLGVDRSYLGSGD